MTQQELGIPCLERLQRTVRSSGLSPSTRLDRRTFRGTLHRCNNHLGAAARYV